MNLFTALMIMLFALMIVIIFIVIPPTPQATTSISLEQMQAKCIDSAVFNDKFEQIEKCLLITKDQEAKEK